ncbi:response regulator [Pedobacter sp. CFBP9032]|uniref:response regulator n=1 Tax=Pedobacter sp. CFBP9032 TaxID=3096539 RepID=UPI002A6B70F2|nr:response regulator [Pedobacter sp. CFBP9032]MDY0905024.1 response regulator [Pedobacter sp. CFBP9032]
MMFKKVLIADDCDSTNISVQKTLTDLSIIFDSRDHVTYCDAALSRLQKALANGEPYDLLITDLSFNNDIPQVLEDGTDLIRAAQKVQPGLKIMVFTGEGRNAVASRLYRDLNLDGYVPKGRGDIKDLKAAIEKIANDQRYLSANLRMDLKANFSIIFDEYDKMVISMLMEGNSQKEVAIYIKKNNIKPSSLSSLEKRLSEIKSTLNISNNEQLIAYCKDNKLI